MLYTIYNTIKEKLAADPAFSELPVEWFNAQYDGIITNQEGFFIEFPDEMPFSQVSSDKKQAPARVRIHHYKSVINTQDGISDSEVLLHETNSLAAKECLKGLKAEGYTRLQFAGWQHWHRWAGWMVNFIVFSFKIDE